MGKLLLLFVLVPAIELVLLVQIGGLIGLLPTVGIIVLTGVLGASLARMQGLGILGQIQTEMAAGRVPAGAIADGLMVLVAGALLLTPGFLTDLVGFLSLVPGTRNLIKALVWRRIERAVQRGQAHIYVGPR